MPRRVQLHLLAQATFGIGVICWLMLGSTIIGRLFFVQGLDRPLLPTMAIEVAPPAVAGAAYFAMHGPVPDGFARALGGYCVLMVLVQLRFAPRYARLTFSPAMWGFSFSYAAVVVDGLLWLHVEHVRGERPIALCAVAVITAFIVMLAVRTAMLARRAQLFPANPLPPFNQEPSTDRQLVAAPAT